MTEQEQGTCEQCGATIYRYCHSQAGSLKAYAWTDIPEDSDTDQRYGTRCAESGSGIGSHVPETVTLDRHRYDGGMETDLYRDDDDDGGPYCVCGHTEGSHVDRVNFVTGYEGPYCFGCEDRDDDDDVTPDHPYERSEIQ